MQKEQLVDKRRRRKQDTNTTYPKRLSEFADSLPLKPAFAFAEHMGKRNPRFLNPFIVQ